MKKTEITARLQQIDTEIDAVLALSDSEHRALSADEKALVEKLEAEAAGLEAQLKELEEKEALRQRTEKRKRSLTAPQPRRTHVQPGDEDELSPEEKLRLTRPKVPAHMQEGYQRYPGRLNAFSGPDARLHAYRAGVHLLATCGLGDQRRWAAKRCEELEIEIVGADALTATTMRESDNVHGGYLVYEEFEAMVVKLRNEYGVLRRNARVKPMGSDTLSTPRRTQGLTVYYPEEGGQITQSDMKWDQLRITARKMAVLAKFTTELDEDGIISLADELADETAYAFAKAEDTNGFVGTGTSAYGGMTGIAVKIDDASGATYAGSIATAATANTAFGTLDLTDFELAVGKLPQYARNRGPKWYISNVGFWASMARLIDAAGGNTGQMIAGDVGLRFLGYPVEITDVLNSTLTAQASTVLCLLGALDQAVYLGTRRGVTMKTSDQRYFEYDQIGVQGTQRVGISTYPGDPEAPTTAGGPVIALKTPGA